MDKRVLWVLLGSLPVVGLILACNTLTGLGLTATPRPLPTIAPITPTPSATATTVAAANWLAWATTTDLQLVDLGAGSPAQTQHYALGDAGGEGVSGLAWSPSRQFLAYSIGYTHPELFEVPAEGGAPVTLGAGLGPAWSPDERQLAVERDGNLWLLDVTSHAAKQLTSQSSWQWGNIVFAPDGQSLLVAGAGTDLMGAQGNTEFYLYRVPLGGSGRLEQLPGLEGQPFFGRLPLNLQLSPDGRYLAFSTSAHLSACAAPAAFYTGKADGSEWKEIASPTINAALDSEKEIYQEGFSLAWMPDSNAVVLDSLAWDCSGFSTGGEPKKVVGPLLSVVGLDGTERVSLPLDITALSIDHTGHLLAGLSNSTDGSLGHVQVYSLPNGELVSDLGEGTAALFQP